MIPSEKPLSPQPPPIARCQRNRKNYRRLNADDEVAFEEERRLFYVALTRAKDELYLTYPMLNPKSYTGDILCRPSRFLDDFPKEMVETWNVGNEWSSDDDPF